MGVEQVIKRLVETLTQPLAASYSAAQTKEAINQYTLKLYERYRLTKNVLFKNQPLDFYDNYVPLTLELNTSTSQRKTKLIGIENASEFLKGFRKSIIVGTAGSGKTTLLRYLTLKCIEESYGIPIFIELRSFRNTRLSFDDYIASLISYGSIGQIKELFENGKFVFIFDGFDEINYQDGEEFINALQNFISDYHANYFVISSRPGTNIENLSQFFVFNISPLNDKDIEIFIDRFNLPKDDKTNILQILEEDKILRSYLTIPLFLSVFIQYFHNSGFYDHFKKKSVFFRKIVDSLFSKHDSVTKLGYVREKLSGLSKDQLEGVSATLAFRALLTSRSWFTKDDLYSEFELIKRNRLMQFDNEKLTFDLTITVNILAEENDLFYFQHILLMEYLAALFIAKLDGDSKRDLYFKITEKPKLYLSGSFLNLLYELDTNAFLKFFLLPNLKLLSGMPLPQNYAYYEGIADFLQTGLKHPATAYRYLTTADFARVHKEVQREIGDNFDTSLGDLFSF